MGTAAPLALRRHFPSASAHRRRWSHAVREDVLPVDLAIRLAPSVAGVARLPKSFVRGVMEWIDGKAFRLLAKPACVARLGMRDGSAAWSIDCHPGRELIASDKEKTAALMAAAGHK